MTPPIPMAALIAQAESARARLASWEQTLRDTGSGSKSTYLRQARLAVSRAEAELALARSGLPPRCWPGVGFHPEAAKGANGRRLCRWCQEECAKRQQTFCSPLCIHEWKVRTQPGYARDKVWERDKGRCALCPTVLGKLDRWEMDHTLPVAEGGGSCGLSGLRTLCASCHCRETAALRQRITRKRLVAKISSTLLPRDA